MKKLLCGMLLLLLTCMTWAAVKPGENLIINGNLEAEQTSFPTMWAKSGDQGISFNAAAGPGNSGAVIFDNQGETPIGVSVRQQGLKLPAGETFKISCWINAKGFQSKHNGVIVHNNGWFSEQGPRIFPSDTNGWKYMETTFKLAESSSGEYGVALFAMKFTGHLEIAKVKMEAISEGALAKSQKSIALEVLMSPRLIPWQPLLGKIPEDRPEMTFKLILPKELPGCQAVFSVDGGAPVKLAPAEIVKLPLPGLAKGPHTIDASVVDGEGKTVFKRTFKANVIANPQIDTSAHVRLNNFVTTVLDKQLADGAQELTFSAPRDGWVFVAMIPAPTGTDCKVNLDGKLDILDATMPRGETFRLVDRGPHTLKISGAAAGARLLVRSVVEIFNYPLCANSRVPQNGKYDWDFHEKYVFPAVTTLNGGWCTPDKQPELRRRGLLWLANLGSTGLKDENDLIQRLNGSGGIKLDVFDGLTCDEQFFHQPSLSYYTEAIWNYANTKDKLIYTWIVGKPALYGVHSDFMSASVNVSGSRGRLIYEAYCHSQPTEAEAFDYLQDRLKGTLASFNDYFPEVAKSTGILLGNFNQIPIISLDVNPAVDYKYYLDMQLQILATDPLFADLATTGYWGSYYDDEELYRWSFKLLRHYCVEGQTELLSKAPQYGYVYRPEMLQNSDFLKKGENWTAVPAADKSILFTSHAGVGMKQERRWGCAFGTGDSLCVFTRQAERANTLSQTVKNLVPGRVYTLQFCSVDYDDLTKGLWNPKTNPLKAVFGDGVEVLQDKCYVFVDNTPESDKHKGKGARVNLHHYRFRATAATSSVTFTDEAAAPGTRIAFNYVMMKPYYED